MRKIILSLSLILLISLASCQKTESSEKSQVLPDGSHKAQVEEVLQTNSYTYLKVNEDGKQNWLAVTKQDIKSGATVYYKPDLEMNNFESKELKRTFESIFFVSSISDKLLGNSGSSKMEASLSRKNTGTKTTISVDQPQNGISIAKLSADRISYQGKIITVRGQVTKYNPSIMDRNWVHIQDGTKDGQTYDLTVTTNDEVKLDEIVTFKGKIVLNKDFGAGYKYDIIMEEATLQ